MNVLIVNTNRCREPVPVVPLGACMVAEAAERAGHRVELLDLMFRRDPCAELMNSIRQTRPDVVGLSVRNLDNTVMEAPESFIPSLLPLVETIRETMTPVILGGAAAGVAPEALLRGTAADWIVAGEGESAFPRLLESIRKGSVPPAIPGVGRIAGGEFRYAPPRPTHQSFSFPDITRWIDLAPYRHEGGTVPLQSKRGCGYACVYCPCPQIEGSAYRLASPSAVAAEIRRLAASGIRDIEFIDTVFNSPYGHAMAICAEVARERAEARLHTFELNPAFVDGPLLAAMEEAGFAAVGLTAESADDDVLAALGKNYRRDDLERAAAAMRNGTIPCLWIFMLGGPGETRESAARTLRFARENLSPRDVAFFAVGVRIYPGTGLERIARKEGSVNDADDLLSPLFYRPPAMDLGELRAMVRTAVASDNRFLTFGMDSLRLLPPLRKAAGRLGLTPPLWRHTGAIRKGLGMLGIRERP